MSNKNKMTDAQFSLMISLISQYSESEMDQFELWKFKSKFGETFINISLSPLGDGSAYTDVSNAIKPNPK